MNQAPARPNFRQITPFLHVPNLEKAISFFRDIFGFRVWFRVPGYAYMHRETVGIRLLQQENPSVGRLGNRALTCYVDVEDVDLLYTQVKEQLSQLPTSDVDGPVDREYGQRELVIVMPDGNLIAFGQEIVQREYKPE